MMRVVQRSAWMISLTVLLGACGSNPPVGPSTDDGGGGQVDAGSVEDAGSTGDAGVTCEGSLVACHGSCVDLQIDDANCGGCGVTCDASHQCRSGSCGECTPGELRTCYEGPDGSLDVGTCTAGMQTCLGSSFFGPCEGQTLPVLEVCGNGIDEDCNGIPDDALDPDGDGYTRCDDDCLEVTGTGIAPDRVNPAAFDVPGNGVDDDCDGEIDVSAPCDDGLSSNSANPLDHARALRLCRTTAASSPSWGILSAGFSRTDGLPSLIGDQASIRTAFGTNILPREGSSMMVLSTGRSAAVGHTNPSHAAPEPGTNVGTSSALPADWLAANGNVVPVPAGCPPLAPGNGLDPIMLTLQLKVPSNAQAFSMDAFLLTADYPEGVCGTFVDAFVALLDSTFSGAPQNPADKNLAASGPATGQVPLSANFARAAPTAFNVCMNGAFGCSTGSTTGTMGSCTSTSELVGTGFDATSTQGCGANNLMGGGSGWLTLRGNVVPGEIITLRLAVWDSGDGTYDTTVLLDNFSWHTTTGPTGL